MFGNIRHQIAKSKILWTIAILMGIIVISPYAFEYVDSRVAQPKNDDNIGNVSVMGNHVTEPVPPKEYRYYLKNTSDTQLRLIVIDHGGFNVRENLELMERVSEEYDLVPVRNEVTGYIIDVNSNSTAGGRANPQQGEFWATHYGIEKFPVSQDGVARRPPIHEYIHLTQDYIPSEDMRWFVEAEAEYYTLYIQQAEGELSAGRYNAAMLRRYVKGHIYGEKTLSEIPTSEVSTDNPVPYFKGSLVLSSLDEEIRERTDGNKTLINVSIRLRQADAFVTTNRLNDELEAVTGSDMSNWTSRYISGNQIPKPRLVGMHSPLTWLLTLAWFFAPVGVILPAIVVGSWLGVRLDDDTETD